VGEESGVVDGTAAAFVDVGLELVLAAFVAGAAALGYPAAEQ
jgi:hypothetical protein